MSESSTERQSIIDFDHWSDLASSNPEAFEAHRNRLIEDAIRNAPAHRQHRLRCLQWRLDQVRSRAHTPLAACIRMSEMMWDALAGEGGLRDTLGLLADPDAAVPVRQDAVILSFDPGRRLS